MQDVMVVKGVDRRQVGGARGSNFRGHRSSRTGGTIDASRTRSGDGAAIVRRFGGAVKRPELHVAAPGVDGGAETIKVEPLRLTISKPIPAKNSH